eukprot:2389280-Rhodomonas_salina.1
MTSPLYIRGPTRPSCRTLGLVEHSDVPWRSCILHSRLCVFDVRHAANESCGLSSDKVCVWERIISTRTGVPAAVSGRDRDRGHQARA